ncbi:MAG: M67 family metallopeptidase [Acidobacteriota bacterium]
MYRVRKEVAAAMQVHAEQSYPNECCGLLGGIGSLFVDYYPLTNRAEEPTRSFFAAPEEIFPAMQRMRALGQQQLGIYHSHPASQAYPSTRDIALAFYPEAINFILSLHPVRELYAFQIERGAVRGVNFAIID